MRAMYLKHISLAFLITLLTACGVKQLTDDIQQGIDDSQHRIEDVRRAVEPAVVTVPDIYIDRQPVRFNQNTVDWLTQKIYLKAEGLPLHAYVQHILLQTGAAVKYESEVNPNFLVGLTYSGDVKGALDKLATLTGYAYRVDGETIVWSALVTKTFNIAFMPGSSDYLVGHSGQSGGSSGSRGGGDIVEDGASLSGDGQYSNLSATLSVWNDLERTINELLSSQGVSIVSQATTTITVKDFADNVRSIDRYISDLNRTLSQQVRLKVEVIEITLNDRFKYGVDWDLAWGSVFGRTGIGLVGPGATSVGLGNQTPVGGSMVIGTNNTGVILDALRTQGQLSILTQPETVTLNNQISEIRITTQTGYLASVSETITGGSDNDLRTTQLTPGRVTEGFVLYILPKVKDENIFLQITSSLSTLDSITDISSSVSSTSQNTQKIQVPTLSEKRFNQRSLVRSGQTLVIAGFKQMRNQLDEKSLLGINKLGSNIADQQNKETIVLITPELLWNSQ